MGKFQEQICTFPKTLRTNLYFPQNLYFIKIRVSKNWYFLVKTGFFPRFNFPMFFSSVDDVCIHIQTNLQSTLVSSLPTLRAVRFLRIFEWFMLELYIFVTKLQILKCRISYLLLHEYQLYVDWRKTPDNNCLLICRRLFAFNRKPRAIPFLFYTTSPKLWKLAI